MNKKKREIQRLIYINGRIVQCVYKYKT